MQLAKKIIGPVDRKRYIIDYYNWLDLEEKIVDFTAASDVPAIVVDTIAVAEDGKSASFYVNGAVGVEDFNVTVAMLSSDISQAKQDHVLFVSVDI